MEVVLLGADGVPEGSVLSLKWGDLKRQAPVSQTGQHFRFNDSPAQPHLMKVEVLTPIAPAQMVRIDPMQETFEVAFDPKMKVRLQQRPAAELQRPAVDITNVAEGKGLPAGRLEMAQQAASYLEEHDLVRTFQEMLHALLVAKPEDPHSYVEEHLSKARKLAAKARAEANGACSPYGTASPDSEKELYKAKRRRSSVREHMRMQQKTGGGGCSKVETLLMTLEAASNNLELVLPFIPQKLRDGLAQPGFARQCEDRFRALDRDDRGELTSDDLIPEIVRLSQTQKESISTEQCRKFADMFDSNQDGLINISEFTQMVQFITVAGWLESEEGKHIIQKAEVADLLRMIEADKDRLWSIIPFLPEWLVNHLTGKEFEEACHEQFDALDVDGNGSLEPVELVPIIQAICKTEEHELTITEERCQRFTTIFDTDGNGVIRRDEFIEFAQFLSVMNFLTNTDEGQDVSKMAGAVVQGTDTNQMLMRALEEDPDCLQEVLQQLPKPLFWEITSLDFQKACMDGFRAAAGDDCDASSTVPPGMLAPVINQLVQVHPFRISEEQCNYYMSRWDRDLKNAVTPAEFLLLARYCIVMGYLQYLVENQDALMADVMLGQEKMESMLQNLRSGSEMVWDVLPFLPQTLVDELSSPEFELSCDEFFKQLDKDGNGTLEPAELLPVVQELTQAHAFVLTEDHCARFVDLFDIDRNGIIAKHEFVNFVRYMMIMSFMETPEGQMAKMEVEVEKSSRAVDRLLYQLQKDRDAIVKVMPLLPEAVYNELVSQQFVTQFSEQFKALDKDGNGVLEPSELFDIIVELSASQPFAVTQQQCEAFTSIFDLRGDGVLRHDEFLDFARFLCIMSYLHSEDGEVAASEAVKVLEDAKRIEDLLAALERDHEAVQQVVPFLPQWLRNDLLSERFVTECVTFFQELDKDGNGTLEPEELFPMVRSMADAHSMALDLEQCKRFSKIFDVNSDGLIEMDEFVNFSRFMIVMSFLHSQEGQLTLSIAMEPEAMAKMNGELPGGPPPVTPQPQTSNVASPNNMAPLPIMNTAEDEAPVSPAHLAVDCDFYKKKSKKLAEENDNMRERLTGLEDIVRKMQDKLEEQEQKLRHAEVDLREGGLR